MKKEVDIKEASEEEVDTKEASEEMVTEDVFIDVYAKDLADVFAKDFADDSTEGLEAELEEQPRAQLSFLPLPNPRRSAEQATQGRGISQVTLSTNQTTSSASTNADSSLCNDKFLACWSAESLRAESSPGIKIQSSLRIKTKSSSRT